MDSKKLAKKSGFSLSENLTVIAVLGIIVALTIPNLVRDNNQRRTRITVRKAVSNYESVLKKLLITATGINDTGDFNSYIQPNQCAKIRMNMDVELKSDTACVFITSDGVKWDLTKPSEAYIQIAGTNVATTAALTDAIKNESYSTKRTVYYVPFKVENKKLKLIVNGTATELSNDSNRNEAKRKTLNTLKGE